MWWRYFLTFSQQTLYEQQLYKTKKNQVIRKPILNLMRMLNFLGNERVMNVNEMMNVSKDLEPMIGMCQLLSLKS